MAALQMNEDLGLSKGGFGFASSLYFVAYFIFEVPSNLAMQKVGARAVAPADNDQLGGGIDVHGAGAKYNLPLYRAFSAGCGGSGLFPRCGALSYLVDPFALPCAHYCPLLWWPFRWLTLSVHRFQV